LPYKSKKQKAGLIEKKAIILTMILEVYGTSLITGHTENSGWL
jgi:hypothetical protein